MPKKTAGRQRIDTTKLIEDPAQRQVTFSKRRPTLFAYAADLSACFGVDTAVVVFSESGSAFAFGSPSVDAVLRRHKDDGREPLPGDAALDLGDLAARRRELKEAEALAAAEKARMKAVGGKVKLAVAEAGRAGWWEADAGALGEAELPEFERALRKLRDAVRCLVDKKAAPLSAADAPA
ncbi:agamous-like MADS-box protein AGL61 [Lolium rigidum]|uniref:agamous-like MADS-box protein AGL61 n=1 Tax=Lolium rigidum TaxID=89674 RepID=UPI001F5D1A68|nr:agamous-like MADS-box protein AGL61 [Lolium rigidum]